MPVPTGYCTVDDIRDVFEILQDRIKIGSEDGDNITESQVEDIIYKVERRIDARIAFRYTVPLSIPVDNVVEQIAVNQTAFDIYRGMPFAAEGALPDAVYEWKNLAEGLLKDIVSGRIYLTVPTTATSAIQIMTSNLRKAREIEVRLTGTDWQAIGYEFIVPNSFIAAPSTDEGFPTTYTLGTDFEVMWKQGYMRRLQGSNIVEGSLIYLYFLYQKTEEFQEGTRPEMFPREEGYV